jgi:hypothetical protein
VIWSFGLPCSPLLRPLCSHQVSAWFRLLLTSLAFQNTYGATKLHHTSYAPILF